MFWKRKPTLSSTLRPDPEYRERRLRALAPDRREKFKAVVKEFQRG